MFQLLFSRNKVRQEDKTDKDTKIEFHFAIKYFQVANGEAHLQTKSPFLHSHVELERFCKTTSQPLSNDNKNRLNKVG